MTVFKPGRRDRESDGEETENVLAEGVAFGLEGEELGTLGDKGSGKSLWWIVWGEIECSSLGCE